MSLIIDIDPVPWKILDLVKARILKNRAKKAKKGTDWSKETLKREMSLQPGPLSRRKKDEPSFIYSSSIHYSISIIDEDDNYSYTKSNLDWENWSRKQTFAFINPYDFQAQEFEPEDKRFVLIIPRRTDGTSIVFYPNAWPTLSGSGESVGVSFYVARYDSENTIQAPSDYFELIKTATGISWDSVKSVKIAVDASGSMVRDTVAPDLNLFLSKLQALEIPFNETYMHQPENWIYSHTIDS